jgi:hypothetical protein
MTKTPKLTFNKIPGDQQVTLNRSIFTTFNPGELCISADKIYIFGVLLVSSINSNFF